MKLHDILTPLAGQQVTYGTTLYTLSEVGDDYIALTHTSDPGVENVVYIPYTGLSTFSVYSNHGAVSIKVHSQRQQV